MAEAPKPISRAQSSPRRAPSLMMVTLTGPTGTESMKPEANPVMAASRKWWPFISMGSRSTFLVFLFLNFVADLARNARANETVKQINCEHQWHDDRQDQIAKHDQSRDKDDHDHRFEEGAARPQIQSLEGRILDLADHHERQKQQQPRQQITPRSGRQIGAILIPHQKPSQRRHQTRRRRNGKPQEFFPTAPAGHGG